MFHVRQRDDDVGGCSECNACYCRKETEASKCHICTTMIVKLMPVVTK